MRQYVSDLIHDEPDFYDVSLTDGFNLPIAIEAIKWKCGNCGSVGCEDDLRHCCPSKLVMGSLLLVACGPSPSTDEYCCRGSYENPLHFKHVLQHVVLPTMMHQV
ncbi:pathogenesis-related thaumatin family protein [Medicago truncatula]|uniref:Pathogenesis-related thaumatin family protein n=1 Tax=Medicago truncatula TaxID=3880 RepID=G7L9I4_MEDTR|nr:pathogenesis-related thaumatin family protein [Medicago truncatula]